MQNYHFIKENSHKQKIKTIIISTFILVLIILSVIFFSNIWLKLATIPGVDFVLKDVKQSILSASPQGLFYAHLLGGIFFVPSPDEVIFYYGLVKTNLILLCFIAAISGYMLAQLLNYYLGLKISPFILNLVSKKKVYKSRRFINKYGVYGIFLFNFLPFPAPLLTFALGIAKYNFTRLFIVTLIGKSCKYLVVTLLFLLFSK